MPILGRPRQCVGRKEVAAIDLTSTGGQLAVQISIARFLPVTVWLNFHKHHIQVGLFHGQSINHFHSGYKKIIIIVS